jgi:hypothetical protein
MPGYAKSKVSGDLKGKAKKEQPDWSKAPTAAERKRVDDDQAKKKAGRMADKKKQKSKQAPAKKKSSMLGPGFDRLTQVLGG